MSRPVDLKIPLVPYGGRNRYGSPRLGRHGGGGIVYTRITASLPIYVGPRSIMAHRVRQAYLMTWDKGERRVGINFWCGNCGDLPGGYLAAVPPSDMPLCGTCEGRAVGAGYPGIAILQQRYELLYSPREGRAPAPAAREVPA